VKIKPGVQVGGLQPEMVLALLIIEPILAEFDQETVITSATDSQHSAKSRHYIGYGLDLRSRNVTDIAACEPLLQSALGPEYYIFHEVNHWHLQFNGSPRV
jgi:hypothetical protein